MLELNHRPTIKASRLILRISHSQNTLQRAKPGVQFGRSSAVDGALRLLLGLGIFVYLSGADVVRGCGRGRL